MYEVTLPEFRGPLDLLLHLIQERRLDITKVSLAQVTDQYLEYLNRLEELKVENLADFVVIAAQLLLIKSRMLLPQPPVEEEPEEDIGDQLVQRLLEYQRFKAAAEELGIRGEALHAYPRPVPPPPLKLHLEGISLDNLVQAMRRILAQMPTDSVGTMVRPISMSLPAKIAEMEGLFARRKKTTFRNLLKKATSRLEVVLTFLALLQLIKRRKVKVTQKRPFGEIVILSCEVAKSR